MKTIKNYGIEERVADPDIGAIGYTDFSAIYLSPHVQGASRRTLRKHELAHIWLQHQRRRDDLRESVERNGHVFNERVWGVATDLEIAGQLYTIEDAAAIRKPRSLLAGGINTHHAAQYSDADYAEEYYYALLETDEGASVPVAFDGEANRVAEEQRSGKQSQLKAASVADLIADTLEKLSAISDAEQAQAVLDDNIKGPPPSLAGELDAALSRVARKRVRSFSRPSRRTDDSGLLNKGRRTVRKQAACCVYVDRSGSFTPQKTAASLDVIKRLSARHRFTYVDVRYFFGNSIVVDDPGEGDGGTPYNLVVDDIVQARPELSIIVTDNDTPGKMARPTTRVVVVPIGTCSTKIAPAIGAVEVSAEV